MIEWISFLVSAMLGTSSPIGKCDPIDGPKLHWSRADRKQLRRDIQDAAIEMGASPVFRAYLDAVAVRESSMKGSRWHDGGKGLGAFGLNLESHADKWPGTDEHPAFCNPRASTVVVQAIAHGCLDKFSHGTGALVAWDLQACFAGRFECIGIEDECTAEQQDRTTSAICSRMEARGFGCYEPISKKDLGPLVPMNQRRAFAGL